MTDKKNFSDEICINHEEREIKFFCLSKRCQKNPKLCIICLKNDHNKCENDFIVKKGELLNSIVIEEADIRILSSSKHKIKQIIQDAYKKNREIIKSLIKRKSREINQNEILKRIDFTNLKPEDIKYIKKNKILNRDKETGEITASNIISISSQNLDLSLKCYKILFQKILKDYYKKLSNTSIIFEELSLNEKDFLLNKELTTEKFEDGIIVKRQSLLGSTLNSTAILDKPLKNGIFEVKIIKRLSTNLYDCFLNCGFITEEKKKSVEKNSFILPFTGTGVYAYHGYNQSNLTGNFSLGKKDYLENLKEIFLEVNEGDNFVRVYNESRTIDLMNSVPDGNYYFFVTLKYNNTSCRVRKIFD